MPPVCTEIALLLNCCWSVGVEQKRYFVASNVSRLVCPEPEDPLRALGIYWARSYGDHPVELTLHSTTPSLPSKGKGLLLASVKTKVITTIVFLKKIKSMGSSCEGLYQHNVDSCFGCCLTLNTDIKVSLVKIMSLFYIVGFGE